MEILWAPWRMQYIQALKNTSLCLFCEKLQKGADAENFILHRGRSAFIILNAHPYATGHLMIVPNRHVALLEGLEDEEHLECAHLASRSLSALRTTLAPDGFNVGMNLGRVAGAGVEGHVHLHIVPRWDGDTSFMPVVAGTKVMPESLEVTYAKLLPHFSQ